MPFKPRKTSDRSLYHISDRGIDQNILFYEDADSLYFLSELEKLKSSQFQIITFCLMINHFHLIVYAEDAQVLTAKMKALKGNYTKYLHRKFNNKNPVFGKDLFFSRPLKTRTEFVVCFKYIMKNPKEAGLSVGYDYKWSSYGLYFSGEETFIDKAYLENLFGSRANFDSYLKMYETPYVEFWHHNNYMLVARDKHNKLGKIRARITQYIKKEYGRDLCDLSKREKRDMAVHVYQKFYYFSLSDIAKVFDIRNNTFSMYISRHKIDRRKLLE